MSLKGALYSRLSNDDGVSALVATRIYPRVMPQGTSLPAVTFHLISANRVRAAGTDPGVSAATVQVSCWAASESSALSLKEAVRASLQRYRGTLDSTEILDSYLVGEVDLYEEDTETFHTPLDFEVWHRE